MLIAVCTGYAQLPAFRNYGIKDGLPSSETYCIVQDSSGYIFIGTDRGLVRFDGVNFETFTTEEGLVDNTVFLLARDHNKLWYSTFSGRIGYMSSDSLLEYRYNDELQNFAMSSIWTSISFLQDGTLLLNKLTGFGNAKYSVQAIRGNGQITTPFPLPANKNQRNVYAGTNGRCVTTGSSEAQKIVMFTQAGIPLCTLQIPYKTLINDFSYTRQGRLWVCIKGNVYTVNGDLCRKVLALDKNKEVLYVFVDNKVNIWVGFREKGLLLYRQSDHYRQPVQLLPSFSVSCIMQDREQGLWFTTLENGLYYLPPEFLMSIDDKSELGTVKTVKVLKQHNNPLLLRADNSLLSVNNNNRWAPVFPGKRIFSAIVSTEDKVYFTSTMNWPVPKSRDSFTRLFSIKLLYTADTIFTSAGSRIICFDREGYHLKEDTFPQISRFTCMAQTRNNTYVIGTLQGLFIYTGGKIRKINNDLACRISAIAVLDDRNMAIATYGCGILIMDRDNYKITGRITKADGLRGIAISALCTENDSVLWVGSNSGLGRILYPEDKTKMIVNWADMNDGILSNEINDICLIDSQLWLATTKGITLFPLSKKLVYNGDIPLLIKSIKVNGNAWRNKDMILAYSQNNISVNFIGVSPHYGKALKYCYRLKGKDDTTWNYTVTPTVNYSSLSPGNYVFEYGVLPPNQKNIRNYASLPFTILSPFWLKWWFLLLVVMLVASLLWIAVHARFRAIKRRMQLITDLNAYREKALRRQMSPHFIYNSLNLVSNFVMKQDAQTSMSILANFSRLMRLTFKNTGEELVTIESDLEALKLYVDMERMRFPKRFDIEMPVDLLDEIRLAHIPPLLLQPFLENAILHGLLPKMHGGQLSLQLIRENDAIKVTIKDNGIGRQAAAEIRKRKSHYRHDPGDEGRHSGITVTTTRIKQVWGKTPEKARFKIVDLYSADDTASGTVVEFYLPFIP